MSEWVRACTVRLPQTQDEALAALEMIDAHVVEVDSAMKRTDNLAFMEGIRRAWVVKRAEVTYALAKLRAGETVTTPKGGGRLHFIHDRACATLAALDELTAAGVTLTPLATDLAVKCAMNLPPGFRERWTAEVLPVIRARVEGEGR